MHDSFELIREAEARQLVVQPDEIDFIIGLCVPKIRFGVDAASGRRKLAS
jgi:hypothetical protein